MYNIIKQHFLQTFITSANSIVLSYTEQHKSINTIWWLCNQFKVDRLLFNHCGSKIHHNHDELWLFWPKLWLTTTAIVCFIVWQAWHSCSADFKSKWKMVLEYTVICTNETIWKLALYIYTQKQGPNNFGIFTLVTYIWLWTNIA